jgi:hypothetical protein
MDKKKKRLLKLGIELAITGEEVTRAQKYLGDLIERKGYSMSSPEAVAACQKCGVVEQRFLTLEKEYHSLLAEIKK